MIKAIIFDLDGVLVDAVEWHYVALNRALSLFGYQISSHEHESLYNGLPTSVKLELLTQRKGLPRGLHTFVNEMKQIYTRQIVSSACTPDVALSGMLRHLKAQGYRLACASNSIRASVELMLERKAIKDHFEVILSNEDVAHPKPDPEIYQKCLSQMRLNSSEVLIVEDSIPGIQSARQTTSHVAVVSGPEEVTLDLVLRNISYFNDKLRLETSSAIEQAPAVSDDTIEIVIPMAGLGQRFVASGYDKPKPLIDVFGKPMIQWVVENVRPSRYRCHITFICNQKHIVDYHVNRFLTELVPGCSVIAVPGVTEGAACTVLLAREQMRTQRPLLMANSDQFIEISIDSFLDDAFKKNCSGSIMTFKATEKKWSFAKVNSNERVIEVAEKNPISDHATVGIYFFKHARDFVDGAEAMIRKDIRTNGEFYVCPVYNELIANDLDVRIHEIDRSQMHGMGTPEDLEQFLNWRKAA